MLKSFRLWLLRINEDKMNLLIFKLHHYKLLGFKIYSSFISNIIISFKGIGSGKGNTFFGIPCFHRYPFSKILIGNKCTFRSDHTSNLIGVNHKCILSTHDEKAIIKIGDKCGFSGVSIGAAKEIIIGNNVLCGANVVITDFDWHLDISNTQPKTVIIHNNVWIGLNTVILKGVEIGENTIIGASSLVVNNIPANVIAGGNPCKVLKVKE